VTKPASTGGAVTIQTVKEQLLYEIGDPGNYLSPDATVSFLTLRAEQATVDRVRISGATGRPPPRDYKVSATYRDGYKAHGTLTGFGHDAVKKPGMPARRCSNDCAIAAAFSARRLWSVLGQARVCAASRAG